MGLITDKICVICEFCAAAFVNNCEMKLSLFGIVFVMSHVFRVLRYTLVLQMSFILLHVNVVVVFFVVIFFC